MAVWPLGGKFFSTNWPKWPFLGPKTLHGIVLYLIWYRIVFRFYWMVLHGVVLYVTVLHGIALLAMARGLLYLARHLSTFLYNKFYTASFWLGYISNLAPILPILSVRLKIVKASTPLFWKCLLCQLKRYNRLNICYEWIILTFLLESPRLILSDENYWLLWIGIGLQRKSRAIWEVSTCETCNSHFHWHL